MYGHAVKKLLKVLRCKLVASGAFPEGAIEFILLAVLGSTLPLTEMGTKNISLKVKAVCAKG
jgi:hypothetical protein